MSGGCVRPAYEGGLTAAGLASVIGAAASGRTVRAEGQPSEVVLRLRVSVTSANQWHQLWRSGGREALAPAARAGRGAGCRRAALRSLPGIWSRVRPRTAGWRTRCGLPLG